MRLLRTPVVAELFDVFLPGRTDGATSDEITIALRAGVIADAGNLHPDLTSIGEIIRFHVVAQVGDDVIDAFHQRSVTNNHGWHLRETVILRFVLSKIREGKIGFIYANPAHA